MFKDAGATRSNPVVSFDGNDVAIMYDTPHLIKSAKSMLMKHNVVFDKQICTFNDIVKLYDIDRDAMPRLVPKLSDKCVYNAPFTAMNVAQATRTLSHSVAKGIQFYVQQHDLPKSALKTARYAEFHDNLFDTFNAKPYGNSSKVFVYLLVFAKK